MCGKEFCAVRTTKRIKELLDFLSILNRKRDGLKEEATKQMAPLNVLFDWNIPAHLFEKTIKLVDMDQYFDSKKAAYLRKKYGFGYKDQDTSTVYVQSGNILGNPFLLCKDYHMHMYNDTYTGSLTIHWTTVERNSEGNFETVYHSETLHASVSAPAPHYGYRTYLVYGNDAAPNLRFSRTPSGMSRKSDKEVDKYVKKESKKLVKKGEKELISGGTYQTFGNEEFEVLFGGTNRNNELEYRLLFTPLAQKNLIDLIRNGKPYGDDFKFTKQNCLNYIESSHSQFFNYRADPMMYVSYDYDYCREKFLSYNCEYFEALYFDLAPLMCIPLYQQHKSLEYLYNEEIDANFAEYEHERMANTFHPSDLKHPQSTTSNIYKTQMLGKVGNSDKIRVTAHSFRGEPRVTYVSRWGGDGKWHDVPVHWTEYFPVEKDTDILVSNVEATRYEYNAKAKSKDFTSIINKLSNGRYHFERCVFAAILNKNVTEETIEKLNSVLKEDTSSVQTLNEMLKSLDKELSKSRQFVDQGIGSDALGEAIGKVKEVDIEELRQYYNPDDYKVKEPEEKEFDEELFSLEEDETIPKSKPESKNIDEEDDFGIEDYLKKNNN